MPELCVRLMIPFSEPLKSGHIGFTRWFPSEEDEFECDVDGLTFRVWFDEDCLDSFEDLDLADPEKLKKARNLYADGVKVESRFVSVSKKLTHYLCNPNEDDQAVPPEIADEYEELGRVLHAKSLFVVNRLLDFFRIEKGQYWVSRYDYDPQNSHSFFNHSRARVICPNRESRWNPPPRLLHANLGFLDETRLLSRDEWQRLIAFVQGEQKPDLIRELLTNADELHSQGHERAALVEAVSALEIAIERFVDHPRVDTERLDLHDLPRIRSKLGLRGSLAILLPLVAPEEVLRRELLVACREVVDDRGNVVHGGFRDPPTDRVREHLRAIRECCGVLASLTE